MNDGTSNFQPALSTSDTVAQVGIAANDGTRGEMRFSSPFLSLSVNETNGVLRIPVTRAFGTYGAVSVFIYSQSTSNAVLGADYLFEARELNFVAGESEHIVNVTLLDDVLPEPAETFELVLASPQGGATLGTDRVCQITIEENDGAGGYVQFSSVSPVLLRETFAVAGPPTAADLLLIRGPGTFGVIDISFIILDTNGVETSDVTPSSGSVRFTDLQSAATITITAVDDELPEITEVFNVTLSADFSFLVGEHSVRQIRVQESDAPFGEFSIGTDVSVLDEDDTLVTATIGRSRGVLGDVTVTALTSPITATAGGDGMINFADLQSFSLISSGYCAFDDVLIVLNPEPIPEFTSTVGSTGESVNAPNTTQSQLYQWNGIYHHKANLETNNAIRCVPFTISEMSYFVILNKGVSSATETVSRLYSWDGEVRLVQDISTDDATDAAVSMIDDIPHLVILNTIELNQLAPLQIFAFSEGLFRFSSAIDISGRNARLVTTGDERLLIISHSHGLTVFRVSQSWELVQSIAIVNPITIQTHTHKNQALIFIATDSTIIVHAYNGESFILFSTLPFSGVTSLDSFVLGNELYVTASAAQTSVLYWNSTSLTPVLELAYQRVAVLIPPLMSGDSVYLASVGDNSSIGAAFIGAADYLPR